MIGVERRICLGEVRGRLNDVDRFAASGIGLDRGTVRLVEGQPGWPALAEAVRDELTVGLAGRAIAIEHIGSTAVAGLVAKPILDFAVGIRDDVEPLSLQPTLERLGWQFRTDAGDEGGLLFVLETRPMHRVAHVHVVAHHGLQWRNYLRLRDRLRIEAAARNTYCAAKLRLGERFPNDRGGYTAGKAAVIRSLLDG